MSSHNFIAVRGEEIKFRRPCIFLQILVSPSLLRPNIPLSTPFPNYSHEVNVRGKTVLLVHYYYLLL
jgi:hypothetical protein